MALQRRVGAGSIASIFLVALAPAAHAQLSPFSSFSNSAAPGGANGAQQPLLTYGIDAGVGESDNVTLAHTDKISQTIAITDLDFSVNEQSRLLTATAKGDFSYLDYLQDAYGGQLIGRFDGLARAALVPDELTWVAQDDFGQAALDPYTPVTPNNIENINYFATGPDLVMRFAGVDFVNFSARYSRAQYSGQPFDSNRASAYAGLGRDVSAGATLSVNVGTEKVFFDNTTVNTDFDRSSAYGRYLLHGARTDFEVDAGATTIRNSAHTVVTPAEGELAASAVSQPAYSTTGPLAKVQISRQVSPAARVTVAGGRELTDASSSFSTLQSGAIGLVGTATAILTSAPYTSDFASASWTYALNRTTVALSVRWEKDTYPGQQEFDVRDSGAQFSVQRRLTHALTLQVIGRYYKYDYPNTTPAQITALSGPVTTEQAQLSSADYSGGLVGAGLAWRHGRGLEIRLTVDHDLQHAAVAGDDYTENRVFLTVGYRPSATPEVEDSGALQ
jgi:hypothetical protein